MNLITVILTWSALIALIYCNEETEEEILERIVSELKLTDWNLADYYEDIIKTEKEVILHKQSYRNKIKLSERYGSYLKEQSTNFLQIPEQDIPYEYTRNYTVLLKPGDSLLNNTEFSELVTFAVENDHLSRNLQITHPEDSNIEIGKQTFLDLLTTSSNISNLQDMWSNWQDVISQYHERYGNVLSLVTAAASRNELYDAKSYWEMLTEYEDGYQKAATLWNDIEPTYKKLYEFVLKRINNYYESNFTYIPAYLTRSVFGEDWSNLADIVIPHQQMYNDAKFAFETLSLEDIYKLADSCGENMGFRRLTKEFWSNQNFACEICSPTLLVYPYRNQLEILTCNNLTWHTYISAHEIILDGCLKSLDFQSLPRRELRYSFLNEAIISLGTIIAVHNLPNYGFTSESAYIEFENTLSAKLLVALRILPQLAYYISADVWRLEELQNPSTNIATTWWDIRKKYQGVEGISNTEPDFLGDPYIIMNKPYLAKILGIVLQFELLSYSQLEPFTHNSNLAEKIGEDNDYRTAIRDIPIKSPGEVLSYNYGISEVKSQYLIEFFEPLMQYMENAPLVPYPSIPKQRKVKVEVPPKQPEEINTTEKVTTTTLKSQKHETPVVQNDEVSFKEHGNNKSAPIEPVASFSNYSPGIYILITAGACFFIFVAVVIFKKTVKMRRPRTNNRRFQG